MIHTTGLYADPVATDADDAQPSVVIAPTKALLRFDLKDIWTHRELLYFMIWREIKLRYKQTAIGVSWAVFQPLITMIIFWVIFGIFARLPSDSLPYPVFALAGLLPWMYFSQALTRGSLILVVHSNLLTKVYFPRLILSLAAVLAPAVDFCISFLALVGLMLWYGIVPTWGIVALPLFMLLALMAALSVSLWLGPLNVHYRDVAHTIPFIVQVWMYASPVAYSVRLIPEEWRSLYSLNPMAGVIEGFRWALFGKESPDMLVMAVSSSAVLVLMVGGLVYFRQMEKTFADVV